MSAGRIAAALAAVALIGAAKPVPVGLRAPASFDGIAGKDARSVALFQEMGKVIQSPRCMNCHPRTDRPNQGDLGLAHNPPVVRGKDGHGAAGLECTTCHGAANVNFANGSGSIPATRSGRWPRSRWRGRARHSARSAARFRTRSATAARLWQSWSSITGRTYWSAGAGTPARAAKPAPGTQARFGALTKAWVESGAKCPA